MIKTAYKKFILLSDSTLRLLIYNSHDGQLYHIFDPKRFSLQTILTNSSNLIKNLGYLSEYDEKAFYLADLALKSNMEVIKESEELSWLAVCLVAKINRNTRSEFSEKDKVDELFNKLDIKGRLNTFEDLVEIYELACWLGRKQLMKQLEKEIQFRLKVNMDKTKAICVFYESLLSLSQEKVNFFAKYLVSYIVENEVKDWKILELSSRVGAKASMSKENKVSFESALKKTVGVLLLNPNFFPCVDDIPFIVKLLCTLNEEKYVFLLLNAITTSKAPFELKKKLTKLINDEAENLPISATFKEIIKKDFRIFSEFTSI